LVITVQEQGSVAVARLDHGKVNALDIELLQAITETMNDLAAAPAVVLTGTGTVFSAGVDLRRIVDGGPPYAREFLPALTEAILAVFDHPRPVVAAVNGHAIAGGCVLAAACDLRLMSAGTIGMTELLVGVPFPIAVLEIVRFVAGPAAAGLTLTARTTGPAEAHRVGLIDAVVDPGELLAEAVRQAQALARMPAAAYALTKEQLHRPTRQRIDEPRLTDDPRVAQIWTDPQVPAAIADYLSRLDRRRPSAPGSSTEAGPGTSTGSSTGTSPGTSPGTSTGSSSEAGRR
jgi:enoyl-CoA hydratase